jgi:hypothetical protein
MPPAGQATEGKTTWGWLASCEVQRLGLGLLDPRALKFS